MTSFVTHAPCDQMMLIPFYVYRVDCIPTGEFYYGSRYKHVDTNRQPIDDLWIKYFTSSRLVYDLRKQYGDNSFDSLIVYSSNDANGCFRVEQKMIEMNINSPLCLNMRYYDCEKHQKVFHVYGRTLSSKGKPKSDITKSRMRKPKSMEHRITMSENQLLRGGYGPKVHSLETKNKIAESLRGKVSSDEKRRKIGDAHRGKPKPRVECPHCNLIGNKGPMHRFHFDYCKTKRV